MPLNKTHIRRYRFDDDMIKKLDKLKEYSFVESRFVRLAVEEKLQRDLPKLKIEKEKIKYPF